MAAAGSIDPSLTVRKRVRAKERFNFNPNLLPSFASFVVADSLSLYLSLCIRSGVAVAVRFGVGTDFFINLFLCICGCKSSPPFSRRRLVSQLAPSGIESAKTTSERSLTGMLFSFPVPSLPIVSLAIAPLNRPSRSLATHHLSSTSTNRPSDACLCSSPLRSMQTSLVISTTCESTPPMHSSSSLRASLVFTLRKRETSRLDFVSNQTSDLPFASLGPIQLCPKRPKQLQQSTNAQVGGQVRVGRSDGGEQEEGEERLGREVSFWVPVLS